MQHDFFATVCDFQHQVCSPSSVPSCESVLAVMEFCYNLSGDKNVFGNHSSAAPGESAEGKAATPGKQEGGKKLCC